LRGSDLVFSATGNHALDINHLAMLRNGAYLAGATSRDDEFAFNLSDLTRAPGGLIFSRQDLLPGVARYTRAGQQWHLLGNGNAVNFLHTSAIGPAIHLIKAEIIAAVAQLGSRPHEPGIYEVSAQLRGEIAAQWVRSFNLRPTGTDHGGAA
jgi:adenosylhomocysteinase